MDEAATEAVILGAGGHSRVLIDLLRREGRLAPVAALVRQPTSAEASVAGVPIVGGDDALGGFVAARVVLVNGVGSVGSMAARKEVFLRCRSLGFRFATLVHPDAILAEDVELGQGAQVLAGAVVNTGVRIGENSIVNTGAVVEHDCVLGAHVHVASGAVLAGGVVVKDEAHVGAGATVIQGVTIGLRAVIGAGAAVLRDVEAGAVAVGVPARVVGEVP